MHLISGDFDLKCITGTLHVSSCNVSVMHLISGDFDLKCITGTLHVSTCNVPVMHLISGDSDLTKQTDWANNNMLQVNTERKMFCHSADHTFWSFGIIGFI